MRDCAEWCYKLRGRAASSGQVASTVFPSYQRRGSTNLIFGSKDSISLPGHTSTTDPRITVTVTAGDDLETTLSGGPWLDKWILTTLWLQWDQQFTNRFANHTKSSCACKAHRKGNWVKKLHDCLWCHIAEIKMSSRSIFWWAHEPKLSSVNSLNQIPQCFSPLCRPFSNLCSSKPAPERISTVIQEDLWMPTRSSYRVRLRQNLKRPVCNLKVSLDAFYWSLQT